MTRAAFADDVELECGDIGARDGVGRVAIGADGRVLVAFGQTLAVDRGHEGFSHAGVTFAASVRDVFTIHARLRVIRGQNFVRCVTACAGRGDGKPVRDGAPVNALEIARDHLASDVAIGRVLKLLVASAADFDDVERMGLGAPVVGLEDVVSTVTGEAGGSAGVILRECCGMCALREV